MRLNESGRWGCYKVSPEVRLGVVRVVCSCCVSSFELILTFNLQSHPPIVISILPVFCYPNSLETPNTEVAEEHEREAGIESYQLKETIKKGRIGLQHGRLSAKEIEISGQFRFASQNIDLSILLRLA
jgi:hypothetical protein